VKGEGRRSRYSLSTQTPKPHTLRKVIAAILGVVVLAILGGIGYRLYSFVSSVLPGTNPVDVARSLLNSYPPGSIGWKLQHGQRVNLAIFGWGGTDTAPDLTDAMMLISLDGATHQVAFISVPRDIWMKIYAFKNGQYYEGKINAAFEIGYEPGWPNKLPQYKTGEQGGINLFKTVMTEVTGQKIDGVAGVNVQALVQIVNDVGGVTICLPEPLDDYHFPNGHGGYVAGGIHFPAGCQHINGVQASELARSRTAIEPAMATDFARSMRQQQIIEAVVKKALRLDEITHLNSIMSTLQNNFMSTLSLSDLKALWDFSKHVNPAYVEHIGLTNDNFLQDRVCGPADIYALCPLDPTWSEVHNFIQNVFPPLQSLAQQPSISVVNAANDEFLGTGWQGLLEDIGFKHVTTTYGNYSRDSAIYNYGGSKDMITVDYLQKLFQIPVINEKPTSSAPADIVVWLGHNYAEKWGYYPQ